MASEIRPDLRFGICGSNCIRNHVCLDCLGLLWTNHRRLRKKAETDNYYSCVALRAATKKDINFAKDPDLLSSYIRDCDLFPSIHLLLTCDTEEENNYDPKSSEADRSQLIIINLQSGTIGTVW